MKGELFGLFLYAAMVVTFAFWTYTVFTSEPIQIQITIESKE